MTREEAFKAFRDCGEYLAPAYVSNWIEIFVRLGMLKLDEVDKSLEALCHHEAMPNSVFLANRLDSLGLKIVEK